MEGFHFFLVCMSVAAAFVCETVFIFRAVRACRQQRFSRCTNGKIVSVKPYQTHSRLSDGRAIKVSRYSYTVEATVGGKDMRVKVDSGDSFGIGTNLAFWYDPKHPRETLLSKDGRKYAIWGILFVLFVGLSIFLWLF